MDATTASGLPPNVVIFSPQNSPSVKSLLEAGLFTRLVTSASTTPEKLAALKNHAEVKDDFCLFHRNAILIFDAGENADAHHEHFRTICLALKELDIGLDVAGCINDATDSLAAGFQLDKVNDKSALVIDLIEQEEDSDEEEEMFVMFQSYKSSSADSHILDTRFRAARTRFEQWGASVGISQGLLLPDHYHGLKDENTASVIQDILHIIAKTICENGNAQQNLHQNERFAGILQSRRKRLRWALGGKEDRTEQVEVFEKLVQQLHNLVSIDQNGHKHSGDHKDEGWSDVRQILLNMEQGMKNEMRRDIYSWLGIPSSNDKYQDSLDQRVENTCSWIFDRQEFENWVSPENPTSPGLLWITGPAGFGKTILCARIVQYLSKTLDSPVSYFFFTSDLGTRDTPYLALRSWIHQVADVHEDAFECVRRAWEAFPTEKASRRNLIDLFAEIVEAVPGCTFIADGLDECSQLGIDDSSLSRFLSDVFQAVANSNARLLFISRDEPEIREALEENAPEIFTEYRITPDDVRSDTAAFSQSIVDKKLSNKSEDIRTTISEAMTKRCEGQFLWIRMQEETLRKGMSKKRLHDAVENTPPGLDRLYDHNWKRIMEMSQWEKDRVFALLRWAAFARRALSVWEITEAVLITQFEELDPDEYPDEVDNEYVKTEIVGLCGPLLEVKDMFVHIPHFSVRQYLGRHLPLPSWIQHNGKLQSSYEAYHHTVIARACLQYFNQAQVWREKYNPNITGRSLRWYATGIWIKHMKDASSDDSVWELATDLLREENPLWKPFSEYVASAMNANAKKEGETEYHRPCNPLEYALNYGWNDMANYLINETNANRPSSCGRAPLIEACKANMPETVEKLLQCGADVGATWPDTHTCLHLAVWNEFDEIVKILLSHGADPSAQDDSGRTPLHVASVKGNLRCCDYLIKGGADLTKKEYQGMNAVHMACCKTGNSEVARLILQNGPDSMTVEQSSAGPPLHFVCRTGDTEMAKVLIDHGCAPSFTVVKPNGGTAVMLAAVQGHTDLVKLLLDHGADTTLSTVTKDGGLTLLHLACMMEDSEGLMKAILRPGIEDSMFMVDSEGRTPLHFASYHGRTNAVKSILDYKHDNIRTMLDAKTTKLHTPLWRAARKGHTEVATVLLDHGAAETLTMTDTNGKTALWIASRHGNTSIVKQLLSRGAAETITAASADKDTPLWVASNYGHVDIVKLLLEHGAESTMAVVDVNGETPLYAASRRGHLEIVKLLLDHGAESTIESIDVHHETALYAAADTGQVEIVRELLAHGAKSTVTTMTAFGNSPLYAACKSGELDIVKQLLDHGAEATVTVANDKGNTPLHEALYKCHVDMINLLFEHGAESTIRVLDEDGDCPLYMAAARGDIGPVDKLLEHGAESDIATLTADNRSTIFAAAESGSLEVFQRLLEYPEAESTLMLVDDYNKSILFAASKGGSAGIVKELLDRGMEKYIDLPSNSGDTPLSAAAHHDHVEVVTLLLLVPEVSINHANNYGVTPLFSAARFGYVETVNILLSSPDIELDCRNWKFLTPLHAAVANGHVEIAKLLIESGASVVAWPIIGQNLLWWAGRTGKHEMVELLQSIGLTEDSLGPFRYFQREAPPDDAPTVVCDVELGYCDVCTLTVENDKGYGCNKCWIWATLVTNTDYLKGVLTLNYRLRCVKSKYPLLVLYTSALSEEGLDVLKKRDIRTLEVERISPTTSRDYLEDSRFTECWTKLIAFSLTDFSRIVLLDSDMLPLHNMDELMDVELDAPSDETGAVAQSNRLFAASHACTCNPLRKAHYPPDWIPANCSFTSQHDKPEIAQTHGASLSTGLGKLNSGLLVINPSKYLFDQILAKMDDPSCSEYKFPDQDLLADVFKDRWVALPYIYNALKTMRNPSVHGAIWRDGRVKNVHYIMSPKPWDELAADGSWAGGQETHKWWHDAYKSMLAEEKALGL
ncbi:hypothetical protein HYE67_006673 [Fusarium culmorum]|uniref:Ankyrin repeat protein n=1 Tax=Fusarium culmorum TaxID=5516 RepID=A0A7S8D9F1_FUSCU|nr:hypothetical protein HYE67_006673 [Fusarium culmorum]